VSATGLGFDARTSTDHAELTEVRRQYRAFVTARLALVVLFVGLWLLLFFIRYPMPAGFLAVLLAEATVLAGFLALVVRAQQLRTLHLMHYLLLVIELACHTAMVYFLGGVSWLGVIAYVYALMYTAVFLTWRQAVAFTAVVCLAYLAIVMLDGAGVLPHQWYLPQGPDRYRDPEFLVTTSVAFVGVLATITFWMVFIGSELRRERDVALRANAEMLRVQTELRELNEELEKKVEERTRVLAWRAEHDQLTGLLDRGAVSKRCHELLVLARRGGRPLCVVVADVDRFKSCNDLGGHSYGDNVLRALADTLQESCRESDVLGRLGGDEFLIVLPDTSGEGAVEYCSRVLRELDARRRDWKLAGPPMPSLSLGVAVFPDHGADVDESTRVADRAMYDAKNAGGARAVLGYTGARFFTRKAMPTGRAKPAG